MKTFFALIFMIIAADAIAGTCTSITRTNNSSNQVLTSTKYNTDHNTAYTAINAFDAGCITDGTLEDGALNTTDFEVLLNGIKEGCKVTYIDANTLTIGACRASVNGSFVKTSSGTNVTWGCANCSAQANATVFYVYIAAGSSGSTLTPLISTTAPNSTGYDNSNNKVLARFFNKTGGDIDTYSIDQWIVNKFLPQDTGWIDGGAVTINATTSNPSKGTVGTDSIKFKRAGKDMLVKFEYNQTATGTAGTGDYIVLIPGSVEIDSNFVSFYSTVEGSGGWKMINSLGSFLGWDSGTDRNITGGIVVYDASYFRLFGIAVSGAGAGARVVFGPDWALSSTTLNFAGIATFPILGWYD